MLTVLGLFIPSIKVIQYSIMTKYCIEKAKYYCEIEDAEKVLYWSNLATDYLLKQIDLEYKKRAK